MKKTFILLATIFGLCSTTYAQTIFEKSNTIVFERIKKDKKETLKRNFDWTTYNRGKDINSFGEFSQVNSSVKSRATEQNDIKPFGNINAQRWAYGKNVDNNETILFSIDSKYGPNATFTLKTYTDDLKVDKQFTISIPETTTRAEAIADFSAKILDNNDKLIVGVYVHFTDGGQGPESVKDQIWFVNEAGEVLYKEDTTSAEFLTDSKGKQQAYTYKTNDDFVTIKKINLTDTSKNLEYKIPFSLANFYVGMPIVHKNLNGKDYVVLARYTEQLVDNSTLEFNTNAKFALDFIDAETFVLDKTYTLPVIGFDEENPYTIPMATFGLFYNTDKYDISSNIYNTDSKLEFTYGSYIYDLMADKESYNYFVVNEDGTILKSLTEDVVAGGIETGIELIEIPNQKDQVAMLVDQNGEGGSNVKIYNLPDFELAQDFPVLYNDDILSLNMNRIPSDNSFNYVVGLNAGEMDGDKAFGLVKHYDAKGVEVKKVRLPITLETELFAPFLNALTLNPTIVNDDDKIEYVYAYQDRENGVAANTYGIAQDENNVLAMFSGRTERGNITTIGYGMNKKGEFDRLYAYYGSDYSATSFITDFYKFPFESLAVNDIQKNTQSIKYLSNVKEIRVDYDYETYQVFNMSGNLISSGNSSKTIFTNGWNKGVYVIKTIDKQGKANTAKILVF
ncbi:T9SS type A sorting domain-containing protein [Empedobacter falsenii]|uniref:T9SS type A sorting domain-containing protein n=1 Tax=Empedobacter TaxID=59734 RepID=UPI00244CF903|nr:MULTISPECIES: T9SS type A sorting domain-containing protein [Empedobacter]MDH1881961.1 T9SS type A sorting domain-containing protein [Empedobacter sp. GD03797]MDM1040581.1 T9SS type A sorting domain-containing protein [Empedobacter brevis]MDM1135644.1 T9SS type A sorting domain-containing protein [Empedobacter sp. R750]